MRRTYDVSNPPRWCIWRWRQLVCQGKEYLLRLYLIDTPFCGVNLHWMQERDLDPELHDHPASFVSFILRGWYIEELQSRVVTRRWFNFKQADTMHRIAQAAPNTLTLVFRGPRIKDWGFLCLGAWTHWKHYHSMRSNS